MGRSDNKFSIAVGLNRKCMAGLFFTVLAYENITVLSSRNYLHTKDGQDFSISHQATSP